MDQFDRLLDWLTQDGLLLAPVLLGAVAVGWMLPRGTRRPRAAALLGVLALGLAGFLLLQPTGEWVADASFYVFAATAIGSGVMMITGRDPVYSALWFALVTLSVCGLFLLQAAPFLAAATVIVYAGAIIVTFLFVIMLARQAGTALCDQRSAQPLAATLAAFLLLGALLVALGDWQSGPDVAEARFLLPPAALEPNALSAPPADQSVGTLRGLGRSLFGDYLFAVELAGTLLLVAAIGAIAIAPRRSQGTL